MFSEFAEILTRELGLFISSDFHFKRLAFEELRKYCKSRMISLASSLARDVSNENYKTWGKPGIRAQLIDIKTQKLEMDFVLSPSIWEIISPGCIPKR